MGTIVNVLAIIAGSAVGMVLKMGLKESLQDTLMKALGVATMFVGISSTLSEMLVVTPDGDIGTQGTMLMIFSLVIGTIIGETLNLEDFLESMGERLRRLRIFRNSSRFTEGFVTATVVVCVGAMAIVGSLNDGLLGDPSILFTKSILDCVITMVFASTLGIGVMCSVIPLGLYQGGITLLAGVLKPFFTDGIISDLSLVGSVLIFCIGINLFFGKKVKVANMLPALIVPILYGIYGMITA
ncbi:MAG: DUF554 domain-containing protein [Ruminococcaceae bacterium]|nr:DUF554 domain-containing protein [Oscillospiraceae bacterium]